jgi:serine/threonine protein kinase
MIGIVTPITGLENRNRLAWFFVAKKSITNLMIDPKLILPAGTQLEHYVIESALTAGGFGMVYLASDQNTNQQVVIKEYMPNKLAQRLDDGFVMPKGEREKEHFDEGMRLFLQEATALVKLKHPNIVRVLKFFRVNGTAYTSMVYRPGENLQHYIKKHKGNLSEKFLRAVFPLLLDAMKLVHETGYLHLDIKPGNVHLCEGGTPLLLDFGAVHPRNASRKLQVTQVVTPGFSPIEQYDLSGYVGPWTDIYAMGASIRSCMEGSAPTAAKERVDKDKMRPAVTAFKRRYPQPMLEALDWSMEMDPVLRPQSVDEFLEVFNKQAESGSIFDRVINTLNKPL